ncbi:hypothetical protein HK101_007608 [Irineochytrium annulatum]|nr:hypothetical protein HK101_007608 [Irineochytrium annulatum]
MGHAPSPSSSASQTLCPASPVTAPDGFSKMSAAILRDAAADEDKRFDTFVSRSLSSTAPAFMMPCGVSLPDVDMRASDDSDEEEEDDMGLWPRVDDEGNEWYRCDKSSWKHEENQLQQPSLAAAFGGTVTTATAEVTWSSNEVELGVNDIFGVPGSWADDVDSPAEAPASSLKNNKKPFAYTGDIDWEWNASMGQMVAHIPDAAIVITLTPPLDGDADSRTASLNACPAIQDDSKLHVLELDDWSRLCDDDERHFLYYSGEPIPYNGDLCWELNASGDSFVAVEGAGIVLIHSPPQQEGETEEELEDRWVSNKRPWPQSDAALYVPELDKKGRNSEEARFGTMADKRIPYYGDLIWDENLVTGEWVKKVSDTGICVVITELREDYEEIADLKDAMELTTRPWPQHHDALYVPDLDGRGRSVEEEKYNSKRMPDGETTAAVTTKKRSTRFDGDGNRFGVEPDVAAC